jgi:DNA integrity scanning protein DisA with diadenylate cyclase activity
VAKGPDLDAGMQTLIARELELNGVRLDKRPWLSSENVLRELSAANIPEIHEGKIAPFGVIFAEDASELTGIERILLEPDKIDLARKLANGTDSFLLFEKDVFLGLAHFTIPITTELQLERCFPPSGGIVAQRESTGGVKFFQGDSVILQKGRVWFTKPHVKKAAWKVAQCVSGIDQNVLCRILDLAFHLLSPGSRVGATLVWNMSDMAASVSVGFSEGHDLVPFGLSITNEAHAEMICHLLSQVDGATLLDPSGRLIRTGVHLKYSDAARELIPADRGTRHTSARRFSFDVATALVVTVSEDGPVTIFSDGVSVADLRIHSSSENAKILMEAIPKIGEDIRNESIEATCSRCGKRSRIEQVNVLGWEVEVQVNCPICQAPLRTARCLSLQARPFKRLPLHTSGTFRE